MARTVLITGARSAVALDLARDFRRANVEVHLADSTPCWMARASKSVARVHRIASPRYEPERYRRDLLDLSAQIDPVLIVPTCEEVFHSARPSIAAVLGQRLFAPRLDLLSMLHDKSTFSGFAAEAGIAVPETRLLTGRSDLNAYANACQAWVFKPCYSRFGARALVGPSFAALAGLAPHAGERWIAQRRVKGEEHSFYAVAREGRITAFGAYRSSWRLRGGAAMAFTPASQAVHTALLDAATKLAHATALTGQFSCDAIVDGAGTPWLIECNPRATSGLHLLTGVGALASVMLGEGAEPLFCQVQSRFLLTAMCSYGLASAVRKGRLGAWGKDLREGRDVVGIAGDRLPAAGAILDLIHFQCQAARLGVTTAQILTADMEWNGEPLP